MEYLVQSEKSALFTCLIPEQRLFVQNITLMNYFLDTEKLLREHGHYKYRNRNEERRRMKRYLANPNVVNAIEERLERMGFGVDARLQMLANIAKGEVYTQVIEKTKGADGVELGERITAKSPSAIDMIKAIDIVNRMAGTYNEKDGTVVAREEYKLLSQEMKKEIMARIKRGGDKYLPVKPTVESE